MDNMKRKRYAADSDAFHKQNDQNESHSRIETFLLLALCRLRLLVALETLQSLPSSVR